MADLLYDLGNLTSAVIVTNDPFTQELGDVFVETFTTAGSVNLVSEVVSDPSSITAALDVIASAGPPDVIYLPVFADVGVEIVSQARGRAEFDQTVLTSADGLAGDGFLIRSRRGSRRNVVSLFLTYDFSGNEIYSPMFYSQLTVTKYGETPISSIPRASFRRS